MKALEDVLWRSKKKGMPVYAYIAPIRQDLPLPYDAKEYMEWKVAVEQLIRSYGGQFINLEMLVPDKDWGAYHNDDVDFMHFQGEGHHLVGNKIARQLGY